MKKLLHWLFSKTKLFAWVDGNKRILGFTMWLLGYIIQGLAHASGHYFPGMEALSDLTRLLTELDTALSELLKTLGLTVMVVGVGHAAIKEKE